MKVNSMLVRGILASLLISSSVAQAAWVVKADEANMFGDTELQAININQSGRGLVVQCNQDDKLIIAFIERDASEKSSDSMPTTLYIQVDGGKTETLDARLKAWNDKYSGAVADGRQSQNLQVVRLLAAAKKSMGFGLKLGDQRVADSFDVVNQAEFVRALSRSCKIGQK